MKYSFINSFVMYIFATCVTRISEAREGLCPNPTTGRHSSYDMSSEICCGGHIFPTSTHYNKICCGNRAYNPVHEICCGGEVRDKSQGLECCGFRQWYDTYTNICCGNRVFPRQGGEAKCCGRQSYLSSEASCCHNTVFGGIPELPNVQGCCGGVSYFKTNQICCEGSLYDRGEHTACCGQDVYNTTSELCCGFNGEVSKVSRTSPNYECCGLSTYDPNTQTCCEVAGRSFDVVGGECCGIVPDLVEAYDPAEATCCRGQYGEFLHHGMPSDEARCCGMKMMRENELCHSLYGITIRKTTSVDNAVCPGPGLMHGTTFNSETQVCMEDGTIEELSRTLAVCGRELYDPTAEVCCEAFIRGRFDEDGYERECCPGTTISFKPALQTCCEGNVHDIPSSQARCCLTKAYDTSTHTCDDAGNIRPLAEVAIYPELCGTTPFHPDDYTCCGGRLIGQDHLCCMGHPTPLAEGVENGECCGLRAFDPANEVCCNGISHSKGSSDSDSVCCGYELLTDPEHEICCDGFLHLRMGGKNHCDGRIAFNPETETVCDGKVYSVANGLCCRGRAYNDADYICCEGQLHQRTNETLGCCGTTTYNIGDSTTVCCNGRLHHGNAGLQCCGDATYDPHTSNCCQNDVIPFVRPKEDEAAISCCNPGGYTSSKHTCCGGVEHKFIVNGDCCGLAVIRQPEEEICCGGNVMFRDFGEHTECCDGRLIDNRDVTCCNGRVVVLGGPEVCCGNTIINTFIQTCCGGQAHYNNPDLGCCAGEVFSTKELGCCDAKVFNVSTELCTESQVITPIQVEENVPLTVEDIVEEVATSFLCGDQDFDVFTQTCCGNFVFDIRDDVICCQGQPWDSSSGKTACCADGAYNPSLYECCDGVLHDKFEGARCCGASYYQPSKETCCDDDVIVSHLEGEMCPRSSDVINIDSTIIAPQCQCNLKHKSQQISQACENSLQTKGRIFIAAVSKNSSKKQRQRLPLQLEGISCSITPLEALRSGLPVTPVTSNGTIQIVTSRDIGCNQPSLRHGQKVVIFTDQGMSDAPILHLSRNDVIIPFSRRLLARLRNIL